MPLLAPRSFAVFVKGGKQTIGLVISSSRSFLSSLWKTAPSRATRCELTFI